MLTSLVEFKATLAPREVEVVLGLLILVLKCWLRNRQILPVTSQAANHAQSKAQDAIELLLLLLDDLLLEGYLVVCLVWLQLVFYLLYFFLHQQHFAALLFHKLDKKFEVLALEVVAFGEDVAEIRDSAGCIKRLLRGQLAAKIYQQHQNVYSSTL